MYKLMLPAVTVAGALALAACGGGGTTTTTTSGGGGGGDEYTLPAGDSIFSADGKTEYTCTKTTGTCAYTRDEDDGIEFDEDSGIEESEVKDPAPNTSAELRSAIKLHGNAGNALIASEKLLKDATDYSGKLAAHDVGGSSAKAKENAEKVLKARADIVAEQTKAKTAVDALKRLHDAATGDDKAEIKKLYDEAVERHGGITEILEAKSSDDGSLMAAEDAVRDGTKITATDEEVAQSNADAVADAVKSAFLFDSDVNDDENELILRTLVQLPGVATDAPSGAIRRVGMAGRTFAEIFGEVEAEEIGDFKAPTGQDPAALTQLTGGQALGDSTPARYKGIVGDLVCLSASCDVSEEDGSEGEITGTVVFLPDDPNELYARERRGGDYEPVTNAAAYGYWLTAADAIALHTSTLSTGSGNLPVWTVVGDDGPSEAKYEGEAGGYSYRVTGEGDDEKEASGAFTAAVELTAKFGPDETPDLDGSISGFDGDGGAHVNTNWYVSLDSGAAATPTRSAIEDAGKRGMEDATEGSWSAFAYGEGGKNPAGFVGAFNAKFSDGNAAGVYHAEK